MNEINPISIVVFITFFMSLLFLNKKSKFDKIVLIILLISFLLEFLSIALLNFNKNIVTLYCLGFLVHNSLWIYILTFNKKLFNKIILISFILFGLANFFFLEKNGINYITFIIGALLYVILFILECFKNLINENLDFFKNNEFILLIAPVLFFIGFSFIFGFRNSNIRFIKLFGKYELYQSISTFVNIIYYTLINIYIYKERKLNA